MWGYTLQHSDVQPLVWETTICSPEVCSHLYLYAQGKILQELFWCINIGLWPYRLQWQSMKTQKTHIKNAQKTHEKCKGVNLSGQSRYDWSQTSLKIFHSTLFCACAQLMILIENTICPRSWGLMKKRLFFTVS